MRDAMATTNTAGPVLWAIDGRGIGTGTLNRPDVNNAYDGGLIEGRLAALDGPGAAAGLRAVVLKGNGRHFRAGGSRRPHGRSYSGQWPARHGGHQGARAGVGVRRSRWRDVRRPGRAPRAQTPVGRGRGGTCIVQRKAYRPVGLVLAHDAEKW